MSYNLVYKAGNGVYKAGFWVSRQGFELLGWGFGFKVRIWAVKLGFVPQERDSGHQDWSLGLKAGVWPLGHWSCDFTLK